MPVSVPRPIQEMSFMKFYIKKLVLSNDIVSDFCVCFWIIFLHTCGSHSEVWMLREMNNGFVFTLWVKQGVQKFPLATFLTMCHVHFFSGYS